MTKLAKKMTACFMALLIVAFYSIPASAIATTSEQSTEASQVVQQDEAESDEGASSASTKTSEDSSDGGSQSTQVESDQLIGIAAQQSSTESGEQASSEAHANDSGSIAVNNAQELIDAFASANADASGQEHVIVVANDLSLSTSLTVAKNKTVTIEGNGHKIVLEDSATLGTTGGTLNLNGELTIEAASSHVKTMVVVEGGTLNMNSGVTITGNGNNAVSGGAVSVTKKGTFNMNGGVIENCAAQKGGGVYTHYATFNMSGDAVIQNCKATKDGGGVFEDCGSNVTMSGNALVHDNSAAVEGGGVFVENVCYFTMEDNASIIHNSAKIAGGLMNYGEATITTVYDNSASAAGDDITTLGRKITIAPASTDWVLSSTGTHVTGWYYDGYRAYTDDQGNQAEDHDRWIPDNGHGNTDVHTVEYVPSGAANAEKLSLKAGAPVVASQEEYVNVVWENEDGTVLYTMNDVEADEIPAADEYEQLSGNSDPTEPAIDGYEHVFNGWTDISEQGSDEVVYVANYEMKKIADEPEKAPSGDDPEAIVPDTPVLTGGEIEVVEPKADEGSSNESSAETDDAVVQDQSTDVDESSNEAADGTGNKGVDESGNEKADGAMTALPKLGDESALVLMAIGIALMSTLAVSFVAIRRKNN